jgi:DNA-binding NtrC family response regulator
VCILLVERDLQLRGALAAALQDRGYAVDVVATAADAEACLRHRRYDLLLADWWISTAASGYVLMTPPQKATRHELLTKPIGPAELVAVLERFIGKSACS